MQSGSLELLLFVFELYKRFYIVRWLDSVSKLVSGRIPPSGYIDWLRLIRFVWIETKKNSKSKGLTISRCCWMMKDACPTLPCEFSVMVELAWSSRSFWLCFHMFVLDFWRFTFPELISETNERFSEEIELFSSWKSILNSKYLGRVCSWKLKSSESFERIFWSEQSPFESETILIQFSLHIGHIQYAFKNLHQEQKEEWWMEFWSERARTTRAWPHYPLFFTRECKLHTA